MTHTPENPSKINSTKRRVSFASQAHVRLFEKQWDSPIVYNPDQDYFDLKNDTLEIPDLSTRRTSYNFELEPVQHSDGSFDISITGSDKSPDLSRYSPKQRDSIAQFFTETDIKQQLSILAQNSPLKSTSASSVESSPNLLDSVSTKNQPIEEKVNNLDISSQESNDSRNSTPTRRSIGSVNKYFVSPKPAVSSKLRYSFSANDEIEIPRNKRDSVAHFFKSPAAFSEDNMSIGESEDVYDVSMDLTNLPQEGMLSNETPLENMESDLTIDNCSQNSINLDCSQNSEHMDLVTGTQSSASMDFSQSISQQSIEEESTLDLPRTQSWTSTESEDTVGRFFTSSPIKVKPESSPKVQSPLNMKSPVKKPNIQEPSSPMTRSRKKLLDSASKSSPIDPIKKSASKTRTRQSRKSLGVFDTPVKSLDSISDSFTPKQPASHFEADNSTVQKSATKTRVKVFDQLDASPRDVPGLQSAKKDSKISFESSPQNNDSNEFLENDIMDEQLSIIDDSFYQEPESTFVPIDSLDSFLKATGIELSSGEIPQLVTQEKVEIENQSHVEMLLAASIHFPEYEIYQWACTEMKKHIEEGREELEFRRQEIEQDTPLVFVEFSEGTSDERREITQQIQTTKQYCHEYSRQKYFEWRTQVLDFEKDVMSKNLNQLQNDETLVDSLLFRLENLVSKLKEEKENASNTFIAEKESHNKKVFDLNEKQNLLEQEVAAKNSNVIKLKAEAEELRARLSQAEASTITLESTQQELMSSIQEIESACKDLVCFDPEDLATLRQDYQILTMALMWRPLELKSKQTWLYDGTITLTLPDQSVGVYCQERAPSLINGPRSSNQLLIHELGLERIQEHYYRYQRLCKKKNIFYDVAMIWENLKALLAHVKECRRICTIVFLDDAFSLKATFFVRKKKLRFHVTFEFGNFGIFFYPNAHTKYSVDVEYGDLSFDFDELFKDENAISLIKCCKMISEAVNK